MEITLAEFEEALDKRFANVATKEDLATMEKSLKEYAEDQTETLAAYIAETIAIPLQQHIESCEKVVM